MASAASAGGTAAAGGAVGGSASPTSLLTYSGPISNDQVTMTFKQTIGANEGLRTGTALVRGDRGAVLGRLSHTHSYARNTARLITLRIKSGLIDLH